MLTHCTATTKAGRRCTLPARPETGLCRLHDPALEAERAEWRAKGGRNHALARRRDAALPPALQTAKAALLDALEAVADGAMDPARGTAIATLARALAYIVSASELDARIAAIESALTEMENAA